jgi:L-2,4-diaminobutyrate decarboxylase
MVQELEGQVEVNSNDGNIEDSMWQAPLPMQPTINHEQLLAKLNHEILPQSLAIHHPH